MYWSSISVCCYGVLAQCRICECSTRLKDTVIPLSVLFHSHFLSFPLFSGSRCHHGGELVHPQPSLVEIQSLWLAASISLWCNSLEKLLRRQKITLSVFYPFLRFCGFSSWHLHHVYLCVRLSLCSSVFVPLSFSDLPLSPPSFLSEERVFTLKCLVHLFRRSLALLLD